MKLYQAVKEESSRQAKKNLAKKGRRGGKSRSKKHLSAAKAKKMLKENSAQGHPLTKAQKGYFGAVAGGNAWK